MKSKDNVRSFKEYKKSKRNKNKLGKIKVILIIIFCAAMAVGNLCVYQISASLKYDIHYLKKDLNKKKIKLEDCELEDALNFNLKSVEEKAKSKLDMIYPTESQKRYI